MYVCGPTVYDDPHIGHVRSAYVVDVLRQYLESTGLKVRFVRNVTDVDDKIIEKARRELGAGDLKTICQEITQRYLNSYHEALGRLGIQPLKPEDEPHATAHIDEMVNLISQLVLNGHAYEAEGGDVYFAVRKFERYGQLSNRSLDELQAGTRVEPGEQKRDPLDFALWKSAKPEEPSWKSPWGEGRPGWHIECTAMSTKYLGPEFDLHGGGLDLIFPHHENEIAQAHAVGKPFARCWLHHGLLTVNGEKMSKSLGNFVMVEQALKKCGNVDVLKLFFLGSHYRSPIDYTESNLEAAGGRFDGMYAFLERAREWGKGAAGRETVPQQIIDLVAEFEQSMNDDLNTPKALAVLDRIADIGYQWMEDWKQSIMLEEKTPASQGVPVRTGQEDARIDTLQAQFVLAANIIRRLSNGVFGVSFQLIELTPEQQALVHAREDARKRKDFRQADQLRQQLAAQGVAIEDTERGPLIRPKR